MDRVFLVRELSSYGSYNKEACESGRAGPRVLAVCRLLVFIVVFHVPAGWADNCCELLPASVFLLAVTSASFWFQSFFLVGTGLLMHRLRT